MSGNSPCSRRHTVPIVCSRVAGRVRSSSFAEEDEPVLADLDLVAVLQLGPDSIRRRLRKVPFRLPRSSRVNVSGPLRDDRVAAETVTSSRKMSQSGERPIVVRSRSRGTARRRGRRRSGRRAPAPRPRAPRAPPASSSTSSGPRTSSSSRTPLRPWHEQRAALRAVVGGLRVLEAALRAVDVAHSPASGFGGDAFPARISLSRSRSTWPSSPPAASFCSRATSSARRMSILPCRSRRRYEISCSSLVELLDQLLQLGVGERGEIGQGFQVTALLSREGCGPLKQQVAEGSTSA